MYASMSRPSGCPSFTARRTPPLLRLFLLVLSSLYLSGCGSGSGGAQDARTPVSAPDSPGSDADPPPPDGGSAGGDTSSTKGPVAMFSYEDDLEDAAPIDGAEIDAELVYFFMDPGSDWPSRTVERIDYYCCKGLQGPGAGEPHGPRLSVSYESWPLAVDLSSLPAGSLRELETRAFFADGSSGDVRRFRFEIAGTAEPNTPPVIGGRPESRVSVDRSYRFTPTATDADGDTLSFSIRNKPAWADFDRSRGRLAGTPSGSDVGEYRDILISVSDGRDTTSLAAFSVMVEAVGTGSVALSWQPPTRREDGTPLVGLSGYRLLFGRNSRQYTEEIRIENPGITSRVIDNLTGGTWYFAMTAFDEEGLESDLSAEAVRTVP